MSPGGITRGASPHSRRAKLHCRQVGDFFNERHGPRDPGIAETGHSWRDACFWPSSLNSCRANRSSSMPGRGRTTGFVHQLRSFSNILPPCINQGRERPALPLCGSPSFHRPGRPIRSYRYIRSTASPPYELDPQLNSPAVYVDCSWAPRLDRTDRTLVAPAACSSHHELH